MMMNYDDQRLFDVLDLEKSHNCDASVIDTLSQLPDDVDQYLDMRNDIKDKIEDLACTAESQENQTHQEDLDEENQDKNYLYGESSTASILEEVNWEKIQFSEEKKLQRDLVYNGYHYETQNIGRHFKTSTSSYLTLLVKTQSLDSEEEQAANSFFETNGSIEDFQRLFQVQGLRLKCREYFQSGTFMKSFLSSGKMDLKSKLAMLRHVQKVRQMTFQQHENWKIARA